VVSLDPFQVTHGRGDPLGRPDSEYGPWLASSVWTRGHHSERARTLAVRSCK